MTLTVFAKNILTGVQRPGADILQGTIRNFKMTDLKISVQLKSITVLTLFFLYRFLSNSYHTNDLQGLAKNKWQYM